MSNRYSNESRRLKTLILKELKKRDLIKNEVLAELTSKPVPKAGLSDLLKHPTTLLILGFIFTSILGATFSSYWQSREWHRQQALQARQRSLEQKYRIANDLAQAVGESYAAAAGVIAALQIDDRSSRDAELKEKVTAWRQTKQQWLVKSSKLLQETTTHFTVDPNASDENPTDARTRFIGIRDSIHTANVNLQNILEILVDNKGRKNEKVKQGMTEVLDSLNDVQDAQMEKLMQIIANQIKADANMSEPDELKTFWRYLVSGSS